MNKRSNERFGVRVQVNRQDGVEAVIYAEQAFPDFSDNYEINLGGIKFSANSHCRVGEKVTTSIFGRQGRKVHIKGTVLESENSTVTIRFEPLSDAQQKDLSKILELQQAL